MFKHILFPTDGSDFANAALDKCVELAKQLGAKVTVVLVSPPFAMVAPAEVAIAIPADEYAQNTKRHAQEVLAAVKAKIEATGIACDTVHVPEHHATDGILETADKQGCDLIAMASHGRRGITKFLLGSTAQETVSRSHMPVLIFRS